MIELKARCNDPVRIRKILEERNAEFKGHDHQIDTYFNVPIGKLKIREGKVENRVAFYERKNKAGLKESIVTSVEYDPKTEFKKILEKALGISVVTEKERDIYFIGNIKFHLDEVKGLGRFVEIEAIDNGGTISKEMLNYQCQEYKKLFGISQEDLVEGSYSDMIIEK